MLKEWLCPGNGSKIWKQAFSGLSSFAVADPSFPMGMLPTLQGCAGSESRCAIPSWGGGLED